MLKKFAVLMVMAMVLTVGCGSNEEEQEAGAEFAGGSMEVMAVNMKAAELTKERVYELTAYLGE